MKSVSRDVHSRMKFENDIFLSNFFKFSFSDKKNLLKDKNLSVTQTRKQVHPWDSFSIL